MILQIIIILSIINYNKSHSWLECTNYEINSEEDTHNWNRNNCNGYPRWFTHQYNIGFGSDSGFNVNKDNIGGEIGRHMNGGCYPSEKTTYIKNINMATYIPGQRICLAYPAKNHIASDNSNGACTNPYIPDTNTNIYRGTIINSTFFNIDKQYQHLNGKHENGKVDYKGFQNCYNPCRNPDKSLCTMCFDLENDIESGLYTFQWAWEFNPGEYYYSCWDAEIINKPSNLPSETPCVELPEPSDPTMIPDSYNDPDTDSSIIDTTMIPDTDSLTKTPIRLPKNNTNKNRIDKILLILLIIQLIIFY